MYFQIPMIMVSKCDHNILTLWTQTWIVVVYHEHLVVFVVAVVLPTTVVGAVPGSSAAPGGPENVQNQIKNTACL